MEIDPAWACLDDKCDVVTDWKCLRCGCMWPLAEKVCPVCVGEVTMAATGDLVMSRKSVFGSSLFVPSGARLTWDAMDKEQA